MGSFRANDAEANPKLRPLRVAVRKEDVYAEARDMVADLAAWRLVEADDRALVLRCERGGGLLSPAARVTITIEGPEGIPSATVQIESTSAGAWLSRDKANVAEFLEPFGRRVG